MKKHFMYFLVLLFCTSVFSGCGVIFGGSKYAATISVTDHPNTEIYVNGSMAGKGKVSGKYFRNRPLSIELKEEGCESKKQTFDYTFRTGNFILSVFSWGLIGIVVDLGTGACYKPDHITYDEVKRMSDKVYRFKLDYSGCPVKE